MPELPEVETVVRSIRKHLIDTRIVRLIIRKYHLRWPIPHNLTKKVMGQKIMAVQRRGKYIVLQLETGALLIHLGMSGYLRILTSKQDILKHDHIDIILQTGLILRLNDARRFGAFLWADQAEQHPLLKNLGIEPLSRKFTAQYLFNKAKTKTVSVKNFIMDSKIVVGVGNIYAAEALFLAKIHPQQQAKLLVLADWQRLQKAIQKVLRLAIAKGGTSFKDFIDTEGKPGYFAQQLKVYGRHHAACYHCQTMLETIRIANRSTVYCPTCQKQSKKNIQG